MTSHYLDLPEGDEDAPNTVTLADAHACPIGRRSSLRKVTLRVGSGHRCDTAHDRIPCLLESESPLALRDRFGG
jgi:hypothetical protein